MAGTTPSFACLVATSQVSSSKVTACRACGRRWPAIVEWRTIVLRSAQCAQMAPVDPADLKSITQPRLAEARLTTQRRQPNIRQDLNLLTDWIVYELVDVSILVPD